MTHEKTYMLSCGLDDPDTAIMLCPVCKLELRIPDYQKCCKLVGSAHYEGGNITFHLTPEPTSTA